MVPFAAPDPWEVAAASLLVGVPLLHAAARRIGRRRLLARFCGTVEKAATGNPWVEAAGITAVECRLTRRRRRTFLILEVVSPLGVVEIDCTRLAEWEVAAAVGSAAQALLSRDAGDRRARDGDEGAPPDRETAAAPSWCVVLGLPPDAGRSDILGAWRRASKEAHPDVGGSEERMKEVNAAREAALRGLS